MSLLRLVLGAALTLALIPFNALAAPLEIVASFSILGDLVRQVGGERVHVTTLVGPGEDAHNFEPRPSDARKLRSAQLAVASGLGFDPWLERLAQTAGYKGRVLVASTGIEPIAAPEEQGNAPGHGERHDTVDPHAWQDATRAQRYVANIADALAQIDPAGAATYRDNSKRYIAALKTLDDEIRSTLARIPPERRKVVSSHDAFGYFAHAYGIRFLAPAGLSNQSEPSASGVAKLIRQLRQEKVPAVFVENISDPRLISRIQKESGAQMGGTLYSDALSGPDGPAKTYLEMMRYNLRTLAGALAAN